MSRLRVTFLAGGFGLTPIDETVLGSFIWDTQTNKLSQSSITCYGPHNFDPRIQQGKFAPPPDTYEAGSLIFFSFENAAGDVVFQLNYGDDAYPDPPIKPSPGIYYEVPFDIGGPGVGRNIPGKGGAVVVTAEP
ncbi:MAG: hypothetical protein WCB05_19370 [Candidatus Sulfotelmatobacter sp.]